MSFLEIKQSGPDVPDGAYPMILTGVEGDPTDPEKPRLVIPERGENAGKELYFWDWRFAIDMPGSTYDGTPFKYGTSTSTGPRSKMFPLLTALLGGARPAVGTRFAKGDLIGRQVVATVQRTPEGYCEIVNFSAVVQQPAPPAPQGFAAAEARAAAALAASAPTPAAATMPIQQIVPPQPQPAQPQQPAVSADDLPF